MAVRQADLVLVGGGVMSATLGMILKQLDPTMDIVLVERLDHIARSKKIHKSHSAPELCLGRKRRHAGCATGSTPRCLNGNNSRIIRPATGALLLRLT